MIEGFLMDDLNPVEKKEFETELKVNPKLSAEVKFEKQMQSALAEKDVLKLRETLSLLANKLLTAKLLLTSWMILKTFGSFQIF